MYSVPPTRVPCRDFVEKKNSIHNSFLCLVLCNCGGEGSFITLNKGNDIHWQLNSRGKNLLHIRHYRHLCSLCFYTYSIPIKLHSLIPAYASLSLPFCLVPAYRPSTTFNLPRLCILWLAFFFFLQ